VWFDLAAAKLALVRACDTVQDRVSLADEALAEASAKQLAGFRQVLGTV
jgi:hypothetical protein